MMTKKSLILLAALALTFTGCSNEEAVEPSSYVAEGTPIKVNATVEELTGELTTKNDVTSDELTEFWLQIKHTSDKFTYYAYMRFDKTAQTWNSYTDNTCKEELKMYWAGDNTDVLVTAASFDFKKNVVNPTLPDFANDQSDETNCKKNDWLIMNTGSRKQSDDGVIDVTLRHLMATLTVTINLGTGVTSDVNPLTDVKISGTYCKCPLAATEIGGYKWGSVDTDSGLDITPFCTSYTKSDGTTSAKATYKAFIIPQNVTAGSLGFSLTYGGKSYIYTYSPDSDYEFVINTPYTITLNMPTAAAGE